MITLQEIQDNFAFCENEEERFSYIIELGKQLPPYPDDKKDEAHEIHGCSSTIWFTYRLVNGKCEFLFFSDALIVRGLLFIVSAIFNDKTPSEIPPIDTDTIFQSLGLATTLSNQRQVGLSSVIKQIKSMDFVNFDATKNIN